MMNKQPNYQKLNFILSVIGFIGSLGFYFGVLVKEYSEDPDKKLIEHLEKENAFLRKEITELGK